MKKELLCCLAFLLLGASNVQAQNLLKKALNGMEKINNTINQKTSTTTSQKATSTKNNQQQESAETNSPKTAEQETEKTQGKKSNFYGLGSDAIAKKFASFKKTENTKVIMVDDINLMTLGYCFDNRPIVRTNKNGVYVLDGSGDVVKHWDKSDNTRMMDTWREYPRFGAGRLIDLETKESSLGKGDAVIYDKDFKIVKRISNVSKIYDYNDDGIALISIVESNKGYGTSENYYYIDTNGNIIFRNLTDPVNAKHFQLNGTHIRPLCDGLAAFCIPQDYGKELWGFRDASGKIVIPARYGKVQDFSNGLAAVCITEEETPKWGFVDTKGNMVIQPKFSIEPSKFDRCGLALVMNKEGKSMFMNNTGEIVETKYNRVTPFCNGKAIAVIQDSNVGFYGEYSCLIDNDFNVVTRLCDYAVFEVFEPVGGMNCFEEERDTYRYASQVKSLLFVDNQVYLKNDYRYGLISDTGDFLITGLSGVFINDIVPVCIGSEFDPREIGYVNTKGEWIVKFEENEF